MQGKDGCTLSLRVPVNDIRLNLHPLLWMKLISY
jgi:hypothetical protein